MGFCVSCYIFDVLLTKHNSTRKKIILPSGCANFYKLTLKTMHCTEKPQRTFLVEIEPQSIEFAALHQNLLKAMHFLKFRLN